MFKQKDVTINHLLFGRKLDPDFVAAVGEGLWTITNGMSVVFQTTDQELIWKAISLNLRL